MKKIFVLIMTLFMSFMTVNAQMAIETSKFFDNIYLGVEGGVSTPLTFEQLLPLNPVAGLKLGKDFTPVFGVEVQGHLFFDENNYNEWTTEVVKGSNLFVNGTANLCNMFAGYKGAPRVFEVRTNAGLGWLSKWNTGGDDALLAKTGLDFNFNLGRNKAHVISVSPAVYWNIADNGSEVSFKPNNAQLGLLVGYAYKFNTSNGTHNFKVYNVGAFLSEIDELNKRLAEKPREVVREVVVEKVVEKPVEVGTTEIYVFFAQNSDVLTDAAKESLDKVAGTVCVVATASPEGAADYNLALSQRRADVVKDYLEARDVKVEKAEGLGVQGDESGRVSVVTVK